MILVVVCGPTPSTVNLLIKTDEYQIVHILPPPCWWSRLSSRRSSSMVPIPHQRPVPSSESNNERNKKKKRKEVPSGGSQQTANRRIRPSSVPQSKSTKCKHKAAQAKRRSESYQSSLSFDSREKYPVGLKLLLPDTIYPSPTAVRIG